MEDVDPILLNPSVLIGGAFAWVKCESPLDPDRQSTGAPQQLLAVSKTTRDVDAMLVNGSLVY